MGGTITYGPGAWRDSSEVLMALIEVLKLYKESEAGPC